MGRGAPVTSRLVSGPDALSVPGARSVAPTQGAGGFHRVDKFLSTDSDADSDTLTAHTCSSYEKE